MITSSPDVQLSQSPQLVVSTDPVITTLSNSENVPHHPSLYSYDYQHMQQHQQQSFGFPSYYQPTPYGSS
ncbi:unnamed protein product [Hymenolepis diminuta]|nr:unnamed protein product [Hymenolepis diminuta]